MTGTESILPPFREANQTPDGENAYLYRFAPKEAGLRVYAHDWMDVHEAIVDTEGMILEVERVAVTRDKYEDLRNQESHFDGW